MGAHDDQFGLLRLGDVDDLSGRIAHHQAMDEGHRGVTGADILKHLQDPLRAGLGQPVIEFTTTVGERWLLHVEDEKFRVGLPRESFSMAQRRIAGRREVGRKENGLGTHGHRLLSAVGPRSSPDQFYDLTPVACLAGHRCRVKAGRHLRHLPHWRQPPCPR